MLEDLMTFETVEDMLMVDDFSFDTTDSLEDDNSDLVEFFADLFSEEETSVDPVSIVKQDWTEAEYGSFYMIVEVL
jgi:hypothetical protein